MFVVNRNAREGPKDHFRQLVIGMGPTWAELHTPLPWDRRSEVTVFRKSAVNAVRLRVTTRVEHEGFPLSWTQGRKVPAPGEMQGSARLGKKTCKAFFAWAPAINVAR